MSIRNILVLRNFVFPHKTNCFLGEASGNDRKSMSDYMTRFIVFNKFYATIGIRVFYKHLFYLLEVLEWINKS